MMSRQEKTMCRDFIVGFDSVEPVPAQESVEIMSDITKCGIHPTRLVVSPTIAPSFEIEEIRIGDDLQMTESAYPISCDLLTPKEAPEFLFSPAEVGEVIMIKVKNLSCGVLRFNAAMFGPAWGKHKNEFLKSTQSNEG